MEERRVPFGASGGGRLFSIVVAGMTKAKASARRTRLQQYGASGRTVRLMRARSAKPELAEGEISFEGVGGA
jgi:ubiquitin